MIRSIILTIIFLTYLVSPLSAQPVTEEKILGNWTLYKHSLDSTIIFDAENPQVMINYNLIKLKNLKPGYTEADSLLVIENVKSSLSDFKKVFIQFNSDSTYSNRKIKGGGKITDEIEGGRYIFNTEDQTITQTDQTGRTVIMKVFMENNILRLSFYYSKQFEMEYRRT